MLKKLIVIYCTQLKMLVTVKIDQEIKSWLHLSLGLRYCQDLRKTTYNIFLIRYYNQDLKLRIWSKRNDF